MRNHRHLKAAFRGMSGASLKRRLTRNRKAAQLNFRVTKDCRESINRTADQLGMSTGDYLMTLHEIAIQRFGKP